MYTKNRENKDYEILSHAVAMDLAENVGELRDRSISIGLDSRDDGYYDLTIGIEDPGLVGPLMKYLMDSSIYGEVELDEVSSDDTTIIAVIDADDFVDGEDLDGSDSEHVIKTLISFSDGEEGCGCGCDCCDCGCDDEDWDDEDDMEDEDWDDDDYYDDYEDDEEEPELEKVYPETLEGTHVLFIMSPYIEEGKLIADPYVDADFQIAAGSSYKEVEEKYASDIRMAHAQGLETVIMMPSYEALAKMTIKGLKYLPKVKKIYEGRGAIEESARSLLRSVNVPDEVIKKVVDCAEALKTIDMNDNYHAGK